MKKMILTALAFALLISSCKKEQTLEENELMRPLDQASKNEGMDIEGKPVVDAIYNGVSVKAVRLDKDTYLVDGDMLFTAAQLGLSTNVDVQSTPTSTGRLWPNKRLYYQFDANATQALKDDWAAAIQFFTPQGFQFTQGAGSDGAYVKVTLSTGASSAVGKQGTVQTLNFNPDGFEVGSLAHEIGHALGLHHEQCRPDRDLYVNIYSTNFNFNIVSGSWGVGPFDFTSIMCYKGDQYLQKKDGSTWPLQRSYLSDTDKLGLNYMYDTNGYLDGGTYEIKNSLSNKNLDVSATSGNIAVWGDNNGNQQRWQLTHVSDGYYKIISVANPNKALDVFGANTTAGADVGIYNYSGVDNQLWQIVPAPTAGTYQLFPKHARTKPLDVLNAGTANGTNAQLGNYALGGRTFWIMEKIN